MYFFLYPIYVVISVFITLFACVFVNWWAPLLADQEGNLPKYLYWFQTFDATLDASWQDGYLDPSWGTTRFKKYWARVYWLYRNPTYGFDMFMLGVPFDATEWTVRKWVKTDTYSIFFATGPGFNFELGFRKISIKLGWKAFNNFDLDTKTWNPNTSWLKYGRVPLCFTPL